KLSEYFVCLPHCKADEMNWTFYQDCLLFAAEAAGPEPPVSADPQNPTIEKTASIACHPDVVRLCKSEEAIVKQRIVLTIPDSFFLKVKEETTAGKI
ncbi:uncharacterized protein BT62DRAFT_886138, partial [Guyanagaster necrorhizus]